MAADDPVFAFQLARLLLSTVPETAQKMALGDVPIGVQCRAEETLYAVAGKSYGRVDLRFEDPNGEFTLLAELKLHAAYGHDQAKRYIDALNDMPIGGRRGLIAVTRNVPGAGEPERTTPRWLGSIRWTAILDGLKELPVEDEDLRRQWRLLLDLVEEQGDFGMKQPDRTDLVGWARYLKTRGLLESLIDDLAGPALDHLRAALAARPAWAGASEEHTADLLTRGKEHKVHHPTQTTVHARFLIPAGQPTERLRIQFLGGYDAPLFTVEARRTGSAALLAGKAGGHKPFLAAANQLLTDGEKEFVSDRRVYWSRVHGPEDWLDRPEGTVGEALLEIIKTDITALVNSGILDPEAGFDADVAVRVSGEDPLEDA